MKIRYSKNALKTLQEIIEFLESKWTDKEIQNLNNDFEKFIQSLDDRIISYPKINSKDNLRFALIGKKQVKVFFELHDDSVEILLFLPSKGNPENLKKLIDKKI